MTLADIDFTEEEHRVVSRCFDWLDADQLDMLLAEAEEAALPDVFAELAYEEMLPVVAKAMERTLRERAKAGKLSP